ncbi:hypothetical protein BC827DRAFT_1208753 [Russula dissimulans]|nr:hypothetical protein BC827DRAFT_1208753 [Russula dissimulans]
MDKGDVGDEGRKGNMGDSVGVRMWVGSRGDTGRPAIWQARMNYVNKGVGLV